MKAKKRKPSKKVAAPTQERSYREILSSIGNDWVTSNLQIDAEVFQNVFSLRAAMRDLWRSNPYLAKYQEQLAANVFGENGIMLRSKIKETEDRVVYAPDEKAALVAHERRVNRLREWAADRTGDEVVKYRAFLLADHLDRAKTDDVIRGRATVEVGAPDVYANQRVEAWWKEWQRPEFCDVRGRRTYNALRQLRLWACARDGGHFIIKIKDTSVNRMGFALRHINDEWVDHFYNTVLPSGNVVRMGIEYQMTKWGLGKPVAYHFIKRIPRDWQTAARYGGNSANNFEARDRIEAENIIHYARFVDTESTRPAPWGVSVLGKVRQLDQYEMAEVVAARAEACKTGWLYSDMVPEGGIPTEIDPAKGLPTHAVQPGGLYGLPWGVKYQANNPTHPSGNFQNFRQGMGQAATAGLPGADYNIIFNDLANINFSAGRLGRLDTNEISKMLQRWDIDTAETSIFESGLEMALITGAVPLPSSKYAKLNKPVFQGRRWAQVDESKAVDAAALRVANHMSSLSRENAEMGYDFEEVMFERAEELMLQEELGIDPALTVQTASKPAQEGGTDAVEHGSKNPRGVTSAADAAEESPTPADEVHSTALNGAQVSSLLEIIEAVATGILPKESAKPLIASAFPDISDEDIAAMLDPIKPRVVPIEQPKDATPPEEAAA
jgi:lambda family phage portal protein